MRRVRIDFAIAFAAAFGIGALVNFGAGKVIDVLEEKSKEIVYSDTETGAAAGLIRYIMMKQCIIFIHGSQERRF